MFVQIKDYPEYLITDDGKIISLKNGKWRELKPINNGKGYMQGHLCIAGKGKTFFIHRLVAQTFLPNPESKPEVNHENGNKADNRVENLSWTTDRENKAHGWATGLYARAKQPGERHGRSKLSDAQAAELLKLKNSGLSQKTVATRFGVSKSTVRHIWNGRRRRHLLD